MFKLGLKRQRNQRSNCQHPLDHWKSKGVSEKHLLLLYWLLQSLWLCGSQQTGKFWKRWEYQTTWPVSWEICMQVKKQQLELDMEQQTGSKSGKKYIKATYCHPAYFMYMPKQFISSFIHILENNLLCFSSLSKKWTKEVGFFGDDDKSFGTCWI